MFCWKTRSRKLGDYWPGGIASVLHRGKYLWETANPHTNTPFVRATIRHQDFEYSNMTMWLSYFIAFSGSSRLKKIKCFLEIPWLFVQGSCPGSPFLEALTHFPNLLPWDFPPLILCLLCAIHGECQSVFSNIWLRSRDTSVVCFCVAPGCCVLCPLGLTAPLEVTAFIFWYIASRLSG